MPVNFKSFWKISLVCVFSAMISFILPEVIFALEFSAISNLTALTGTDEGKIQLKWTAPSNGGPDVVTGYLVKYSTSQIISNSFDSAATYYQSWSGFASPGAEESRMLTALAGSVTYYFAIKASDNSGNYSQWNSSIEVSEVNNLNWAFAQVDVSAPASITNIAVIETGFRHTILRWITPCEDSTADPYNRGISTLTYEVRYASYAITNSSLWNSATAYRIITGSNTLTGTVATLVCTGLADGSTYYFSIKSSDENGLTSAISSSTLKILPFNTSPTFASQVLSQTGIVNTANFNFYWNASTAPGSNDDLYGDYISSYTLNLSTYAPGPLIIGASTRTFITSATYYTAANLNENTTFWYKLITQDSEGATSENTFIRSNHWINPNAVNDQPYPFNLVKSSGIVHFRDYAPDNQKLVLNWNSTTDPDPGDFITSCRLYISSSQNFAVSFTTAITLASNVTSYTMFSLFDNTTYYWFVVAYDSGAPFGYQVKMTSSPVWTVMVDCRNDQPKSFNLVSPSSGSLVNSFTPLFQWNASSDIDPGGAIKEYILYYSSYTSNLGQFSEGTALSCGVNTSTRTPALDENKRYYWCVSAFDNADSLGFFVSDSTTSAVSIFYVSTTSEPPVQFNLTSPLGIVNATFYTTVDFCWENALDPDPPPYDTIDHYVMYFSTDSNFSAGYTTYTYTNVSSVTVNFNFLINMQYYWNVRAFGIGDPQGVYALGSSTGSFVLRRSPPGSYSALSPLGLINTATYSQMNFDWDDAVDPDPMDSLGCYILYFSTDSNFNVTVTTYTVFLTSSSVVINQSFLPGTPYHWNVRAFGKNDPPGFYGLAASTGTFTIAKRPPVSFVLNSPSGGVHAYYPQFSWQAPVDPDLYDYVSHFSLYYSTSPAFTTVVTTYTASLLTNSYTMPAQAPISLKTTYYWNVQAYDSTGLYTVSPDTGIFYLANRPPIDFDLNKPDDNVIILTDSPTFSWQQSADPDLDSIAYTLIYSTWQDFMTFSTYNAGSSNSAVLPARLNEDMTYHWKISAYDGYEYTFSLSTRVFRINAASGIPLPFDLIVPSGIINTSTPAFSWNATTDPDPGDYISNYSLYYSSDNFITTTITTGIINTTCIPLLSNKLVENAIYIWYVRSYDSTGNYRQSNSMLSITIDAVNDLPDIFSLTKPTGTVTTNRPVFVWEKADRSEWWDTILYDFYCGVSSSVVPLITRRGISTTTFTLDADLNEDTTYWWYVEAVDRIWQARRSADTIEIFVNTGNNPPNQFALVYPADNSPVFTRTPQLRWEKAVDPDEPAGDRIVSYTLWYSTLTSFLVKKVFTGLTTNSYTISSSSKLLQNTTYYWKVFAYDNRSASTTSPTYSFFIPVIERLKPPLYFTTTEFSFDRQWFTLQWVKTDSYEDNTLADDVYGYRIYRADSILGSYVPVAFTTANLWADGSVAGRTYYYLVRSVSNTGVESRDSQIVASGLPPSLNVINDERTSYVTMSASINNRFVYQYNRVYVVQSGNSYEIEVRHTDAASGSETKIQNYKFESPVTISFIAANTGQLSRPSIFWDNGVEYINIGGQLDATNNRIYASTVHAGKYKIMQVTDRDFSFSMEPKKIFTPNNNGPAVTETMKFRYTNTTGEQVSGEIYDMYGAFVCRMQNKSDAGEYLEWNGRDQSGSLVKKDIYIYQIKAGSKFYTGTIIVAR